ncbi:hypothetical protein [Phenylobacterium sp.]|uniref:hypothetical protein n=1 Tax=Phenylobacterium sp. TaxID=1871053 RepID=UPI002F92E99C
MATDRRDLAVSTAEELLKEGQVASAKVTKETLDIETGEFATVTVFRGGAEEAPKKRRATEMPAEPLCVTAEDLYSIHARTRIGELLEDWLMRKKATPFELLHRPDLVEQLEAAGSELQHAVQKVAVPEATARGLNTHELMRVFHRLVDRAIDRLRSSHKKGLVPSIRQTSDFPAAAQRLVGQPDAAFLLGSAVAVAIADGKDWTEKLNHLLDLADAAPAEAGPARNLAMTVLEQPLAEILGSRAGLDGIVGKSAHLGGSLAALTRLAAAEAVELLIKVERSVSRVMPEFSPEAQRLGRWLASEDFNEVRTALGKRIVAELNGPRRLCPGDAETEIHVLRALAMSLTAAAGKLLAAEDVAAAFSVRSKMLIAGDFVEAYLGPGKTAREEAEALVWLAENVIGAANKRHAARWLHAVIVNLRFEKEALGNLETPPVRLQGLAALHRAVGRCGLAPEDSGPVRDYLGELGGRIEAEARLIAALAAASAPAVQKLSYLLRLASGETAPPGPAADRARNEALKLVRDDGLRAELSKDAAQMEAVRELIHSAGLAA